jgi:hypothetical protein
MTIRGLPFEEAGSKRLPLGASIAEIKSWRTSEAEAGRPSGLDDYCRAHGINLCPACRGEGVTPNPDRKGFKLVGWENGTRYSSAARNAAAQAEAKNKDYFARKENRGILLLLRTPAHPTPLASFVALLSLLATGLLTGNELAVALFIHPVLYLVPDAAHATVVKPLAAKLGRWMPFWYALSLLLAVAQAWSAWHTQTMPLVVAAVLLLALIVVLSIVLPVPINNQMTRLDPARLPSNWLTLRRRWDLYHDVRVLLLVGVDVLLILAALRA